MYKSMFEHVKNVLGILIPLGLEINLEKDKST